MDGAPRFSLMGMNIARTILLFFVFNGAIKVQAQDRCGTVEYTKMLLEKNQIRDDARKFEKWLNQRKENISSRINAAATFKIPVVVHVIHKGEAVGTGSNISDAQIASLDEAWARLYDDNDLSRSLSAFGFWQLDFFRAATGIGRESPAVRWRGTAP